MHLETDLLPTASRSYKSPETLAPAMLCKLAGMLVERRAELGMVQDKRGEALIPALLSMVQGGHSDTDLQQAKLPLLSQALMWENQIMGTSGVAQSVEPVSGGIRVQPMRSVRRNDTAGTPSPRKTQPSEESDSEGSESSEEGSDQADHVYDSLKQVGFNSEDGSPMVEVGWADGTDSWQPEETLCLQGDSGEILAELWRAAGLGKKSKVVITPPGEPILCHTSRGRWRDHLPFAQKMSSKENHFRPPPKDMSSRLGTLLFRWSKLSSSEMPGWSLNEKKLTEALISQIIVGYRALDEETPGFEVMQTMFPFEATFLSLADAKKLTEVGSLKDCFVHHEKNPSQNMFRIANPEGQKIYSLMDSASWPRVAVNKELRSLLPSSVFSPEGSPSEEEELLSQLQDELQDVSLKARSFDPSLNRNEQRDPSQLADILNVLVPGCNPGSSVLSACRDEIADRQKRLETLRVAVLCSNENSTMPDKKRGPYLAPIPEMGTGGEFLNPATGSPDYNSRTTLAERLADLEKVPNYDRQEESNTGDPGSRLCISCNEVTLTEHINSLPAQPKGGSYKNCFNFGPWTPELRKKLQLDNSGRWFCQNCPVGPEGSPTLLPAPGSIWNCPGRGCGAVHQNPCDGVMRTCPSCNTPYGLGNVLPKNLKPQCESKSREVQMREAEEQRLAYVLGSGGHETKRLRTIKGPFEMQTWLAQGAVIHSSIPGLPAVEVGLRHVKGFSGCFFSATGAHGLNVVDFQARYGKIPPLEVSVDAFRDKAIKAKWGDTDMRPPVWAGQGALTQDQRIGLLEQAYSHMADFFVFVYGPNFRPDMVTARAAYEHFIQLDPDNWSADRREALINSIFSDYSRRVAAQQQDWSMDQRVAWEREGWLTKPQLPGQVFAIRPLCYYSTDFIKAVMEPYDDKMRKLLSDTQFGKKGPTRTVKSGSQEEQEDSFPINHKSGVKAEDKEGSEKQIFTMMKQLKSKDEEIAKLKKAEETRKEKQRKAEEKRASAKTGSTEDSTSERDKVKIPEPRPRGGKGKGSRAGEVLKTTGCARELFVDESSSQPKEMSQIPIALGVMYAEHSPTGDIRASRFSPVDWVTDERYCRAFNSAQGCPSHQGLKCPLLHKVLPQGCWSLPDQLFLLSNGGHKDLDGNLSITKCMSLLSEEQRIGIGRLSDKQRNETLKKQVMTTVNSLGLQAGHHVPLSPIRAGKGVSAVQVWQHDTSPFPFTMGGLLVEEVKMAAIGKFAEDGQGFVVRGHIHNMGSHIEVPGTQGMDNCCVLKSIASMMYSPKVYVGEPTRSSDFMLLQQIYEDLGKIDLKDLLLHKNSNYAQLYVDCSLIQEEGLPDSCPMLFSRNGPLQGHNLLMICQDSERPDDITFRLYLPIELHKELWGNNTTAKALRSWCKDGLPGQFYKDAFAYPVLTICNLMTNEGGNGQALRHAWAMPQEHSLRKVLKLMASCVERRTAKVAVASYGMGSYLKSCKTPVWNSKSPEVQILEVTQAFERVRKINDSLRTAAQGSPGEARVNSREVRLSPLPKMVATSQVSFHSTGGGYPEGGKSQPLKATGSERLKSDGVEPPSDIGAKPVEEKSDKKGSGRSVNTRGSMAEESEVRTCSECTKLWVANPDDQDTVCADCRWVKSTIHARRPTNSAGWAVLYQEKVRGDGESRPKDLEAQGDFTNEWYCFELGIRSNAKSHSTLHFTSKDCSKALQRMVSALRTLWFKDRASEGPTMQDIEDFFREKLPTGHMEFLKEIITKGGDPVHSGHRTGYQGRMNGNESPEDEEVVRAEYADLVAAGRGLTFNLNNKAVLELLVRGGVRFAPTFVIDKKLPDGTVHPTKKRIITDCTNRGHVKAVNTGIGSEAQSTQKTTNTPRVIAGALKEEKDFPHSALGGIKLDVASAFSQIGLTLESVGLMASCLPCGVSIVYLVNPFGARSSPGIFEVPGDAIVKAVWMTPRIDPRLTGADHPDSARFVDDVMSVVAHHGDRAEDHKSRLVGIIQKLFGPEGINLEKQGLEGTMENFKYAFGALLDLQKREVKVPGAKLKKAFDLAEEFLTQRCKAFSCGVAQKLRGVLGSITCWCPPMSALVLPRLDAIASNAAKAHPQVPTPPPDFIASPAFSDEQGSESDAWESLRLCLDFFFRLASIRDGALMRVSFEGGLPLLDRLTFPGKETKEYHSHVVSDAARGAVAGFDMQNGLYYTHLLSEGEQEVFNSWDTLDKNEQVSINQLENLANLFSALLLCPHHPGGIQCLVQDNTASENMQLKRTHRTRKDEQIGAVMALVSLIFSTHLYGARVNTEDNPADFFTRSKLSSEAEKFLVDFEVKTGIKPVKVDIPDWMSSMGWVRPEAGQTRFQYWYDQSLKAIDYIIEHHRPTVDRFCPVPIEEIRQMLLETLDGAPLRKIEFVRDFPPHSGPSVQRTALLDQTPKASPSLQSTWKKAEMSAGDELEKRMLEEKSLLSVVNPGYQTEVDFPLPSPAKLSKNWFQELMAKSKESAVGHNSHYKPSRRVKLATCFSGLGVFEQAATDTGLVEVVLFIEHNPNLYRRLTEIHPRAAALRETAECLEKEGRMGQAVMLCTSLPSETHTNSFQPMSDLSDPLCKGDLETAIAIIQAQQLVIAAIVCRPELWQRLCNSPTEMASFQGSLTGYEVQASILEEAEVVSPLTGERSHEFRKSCVLVVFNKKHFAFIPDSSLFSKRSDPPDQFMNLLDIKGEFFPSFRQMPHSDLIDFVYKFQIASGHPAWVGTIHDAPDDSSEGRYPSRCMAPNLSALSSYTASGGGPWIAVSCPSTAPTAYPQVQAGMRRLEPEEVARVKGLRGLDNKRDRVFMRENFTASQQAVGNSPAQPFCDLIIVQLLLHLHSNQGSGPSALERWEVYQTRAEATWSSSEAEEAVIREERSLRLKTGMAVTLQPKEGPPARVNFARRTGKTDREEQEEREEVKRKYVGWEKLEPHEVTPSSERADDEKRAQNVKKRCKEETKISNTQREARSRDRPTKGRWVRRGRKKGEVSLGLKTGSTRMLQEVQTDRPTQELISQPVSRPLTNDAGSVSAAYVPVVGTDTCIFFYPAEGEQELGSECTMIIRTVQFEKEKNLEVQKQVLTHPNSVKSAFQKFVTGKFLGKDIRFNADQADKLAQLDKRYHNDGLDPQGLSGSWRMGRNDLLQVQLPAWMVDADLIFIRSTKQQGGRISVQFSSAPLVVHASAELGQIYKRLHCTGCHEYSDFHRESKFCEVCTPILVTWIQEEALKGTEWTQLKMKECLPILLGRAGKHAGMRWPSIRVQLIDNNRGYLENTPLRLGVNLPGNVSLFLRMIPTLESLFMDHLKENQLDGSILVHWSNQLPCGQRDGDRENKELERIHAQKARARSSAPVYGEAGKNSEESLASIFTISYSFLHWANKEPKSIPKLPASPALLEFIVLSLDRSTWPGAALEACMCLMFGVLLRGKECLSESESHADSDKVVRWKDLILRENLKLSTECCTNDNYGEGKMLTMKVRSGRNGLGTCTRTITKTENCAICAVSAIQNLHKVILDLTGAFPDPEEALCRVGESSWLSGRQISGVLKAGMTACRCRSDTTASFSLRRGGATAYYCAGVPIEDIRIFGRWLSDAYKLYIFLSDSSTIMSKGNVHPTTMVPRFEEN